MGSAFRLPVVREPDLDRVLGALRAAGVQCWLPRAARCKRHESVTSRRSFSDQPLTGACAFMLGGEGPGLPTELDLVG